MPSLKEAPAEVEPNVVTPIMTPCAAVEALGLAGIGGRHDLNRKSDDGLSDCPRIGVRRVMGFVYRAACSG